MMSRPFGVLKNCFALRRMAQGSRFVKFQIGRDDEAFDAETFQEFDAGLRAEHKCGGGEGIGEHGCGRDNGGACDCVGGRAGARVENVLRALVIAGGADGLVEAWRVCDESVVFSGTRPAVVARVTDAD